MTEQEAYRVRLRVGSFVLAAIILFVAFVLAIGSKSRVFEHRYTLRGAFRSVEGLMVGAPVRLAGFTVGRVAGIGFARDPQDKRMVVELSLDRRYQERVREDSVATISTIGLVGDKYVEVAVGTPDRKELEPQAFLSTLDPPDYATMVQNAGQIVTSVNKLAAAMSEGHGLLHALAYDPKGEKILGDLAQAAADVRQVTGTLARGEGSLGALLNDATLYEDLSNLVQGTQRSWILRTLIGSSVRRGESGK